jgi:tetratricopeptide (TPR) repeat protein
MRYTYDNSEDNLANPNDPPRRVVAGNRSSDEMAHLWLQVLPHNSGNAQTDPRMLLQEAMARHNLEKDPGDFEAQYNLAAMLQARGEVEEALKHYQLAVHLRPENATANNALGGALLATGHVDEAIVYLTASLKAQPDNFDAHYNLGNALASQEKFTEAIEQFQSAVRLNPEDANAEANLGTALASTGKLAEAKFHFERALKLNPDNSLARENLEQVNRALANP